MRSLQRSELLSCAVCWVRSEGCKYRCQSVFQNWEWKGCLFPDLYLSIQNDMRSTVGRSVVSFGAMRFPKLKCWFCTVLGLLLYIKWWNGVVLCTGIISLKSLTKHYSDEATTHSQATKNIRTGFQLTMFSELLVVFPEFLWMPYCMCWQWAKIEGTLFSRLRVPEPSHPGIVETKSLQGTPITLIVSCCCQSWAVMTCF